MNQSASSMPSNMMDIGGIPETQIRNGLAPSVSTKVKAVLFASLYRWIFKHLHY